jgi:hypothetical protein
MIGFVTVSSSAGAAIRYQLTESCITRVQAAYMQLTASRMAGLGEPTPIRELGEPAPRDRRPATSCSDDRP